MIVIMAVLFYLLAEIAIQFWVAPHSGISKYLLDFQDKARQKGLSVTDYALAINLDPYLGWGGEEVRIHEAKPSGSPVKTVLFVGDSVTAGHDVIGGTEDYPALLAKQFEGRGVRVVNLAARGYGVDQMWLKLLLKAKEYQPDMIVMAYIPHDLLRPANNFNFGLPKPKYQFNGNQASLQLAPSMQVFLQDYETAKSRFHLSLWYLSHYWNNLAYNVPRLYLSEYRQLYQHLALGLAKYSQDNHIPIAVVKLTNQYRNAGIDALTAEAESSFKAATPYSKAKLQFIDTDACVQAQALALNLDLTKEFAHHPTAAGHQVLAGCLKPAIEASLFQ